MLSYNSDHWISHKKRAFTLIEMLIVLLIMGILTMMTIWLSWSQIQKVKNKTIKESILSEWQSRYSKNLWSSSIGDVIYDEMKITLETWKDNIIVEYKNRNDGDNPTYTIQNKFEIKSMTLNWNNTDKTDIVYKPYNISCTLWDELDHNLYIDIRIDDSQDYCFAINNKNCRLLEVSWDMCGLETNDD